MVAKPHPARRSSKNAKRVAIGIVIIVLLYTAGWFYLASQAKQRVSDELARNAALNTDQLECSALSTVGYPFSLYVQCSGADFRDKNQSIHVITSALDVGASLFSFRTVQSRLTGPATLDISGMVPVKANWNTLKASAQREGRSAQNISLNADGLHLEKVVTDNTNPPLGFDLKGLQFDLNSLEQPLAVKMTFDKLNLTGNTPLAALPELDGIVDITSSDSLAAFQQRDESGSNLRGKSLQLNQILFLLPSGASVSVSGPVSVAEDGLANADLRIRLTNAAAIGTALQTAFPSQAKTINTIVFALGSMPKDESGATIVPVTVRNGKASAGFIPLGRLPLF